MKKFFKKYGSTVLLVLVMAVGIGLLAYPAVSDWWNGYHQSRALTGYNSAVAHISQQDYSDLLEAARAYNAKLAAGQSELGADADAYMEYESLLNPAGTGIMGHVEIKKINIKLPIYHGTADNVLQVAVGHLYGSSLPVGGESTHACISGHTGLPRAMLFTDLTELVSGDTFTVQVLNELMTYEVDQIKVVEPTDVSDLQIVHGEDYCTLITCTPYGVNSHRLLVRGHRVPNLPEDEQAVRDEIIAADAAKLLNPSIIGICLIVLILSITGLVLVLRKYNKNKKGRHDT